MYICIYVYMYICIYVYMYICIYVYAVCVDVYVYVYATHTYIYIYILYSLNGLSKGYWYKTEVHIFFEKRQSLHRPLNIDGASSSGSEQSSLFLQTVAQALEKWKGSQ